MTTTVDDFDHCLSFTEHLQARFSYVENRPLSARYLRNALISRREYDVASNSFLGAVYDEKGSLQTDTLRFNVADITPADPQFLDPVRFRGQLKIPNAVYGGILHPILGHTLIEVLARFWQQAIIGPISENTVCIFHHWPNLDVEALMKLPLYAAIFNSVGIKPSNIHVVVDNDVIVENLIVADRASIYHEFMHPIMREMFRTLASNILTQHISQMHKKVFFSRSRWQANNRFVAADHLDALFTKLGFSIIFPEELSPKSLLAILNGAKTVAAVDGSQAHLFAFCQPGTKVIMLDTRYVPTQIALEKLMDLKAVHVPLLEMKHIMKDGQLINYPALKRTIRDIEAHLEGK